jgi:hypothetical protein
LKYQSKIYKVGEYQFNINYNGRKKEKRWIYNWRQKF